jgi:hypothetical protein
VRVENGTLTTQRPIETGGLADCTAVRRNLLSEWFYIDQGKIRSIYAAMFYPEQEATVLNWPPFDGNWPIPPPAK